MSRGRFHAGLTLTGVVLGSALVVAALLAAALSLRGLTSSGTTAEAPTSTTPPLSEAPLSALTASPDAHGATSAKNKSATPVAPALDIGDCVKSGDGPRLEKTTCGSGESGYKVVGKASETAHCSSDVDHVQQATRPDPEHDSLCLDIDWVVGGCMQLGSSPKHIDCQSPTGAEAVRVLTIEPGTIDVARCPSGNAGFVYDQRRIVVCVARL